MDCTYVWGLLSEQTVQTAENVSPLWQVRTVWLWGLHKLYKE